MLSTARRSTALARASARQLYRGVSPPVRYGVPAAVVLVLLAAHTVLHQSWTTAATLLLVTGLVGMVAVDLRAERRVGRSRDQRTTTLQQQVSTLDHEMRQLRSLAVAGYVEHTDREGTGDGTGPESRIPAGLAPTVAMSYLDQGKALEAYALLARTEALHRVSPEPLRRLRNGLRQRGYLHHARAVAEVTVDGGEEDARMRALLDGETAVLSGAFAPSLGDRSIGYHPVPGRILHMVGRSLPEFPAGYTYRTHYLVLAQRASGLDPHVVTQMGVSCEDDAPAVADIDGVSYHRLPGPRRGHAPLDAWLRAHTEQAATLVTQLRPAALHAASDFVNALTAVVLGRAFGIPVIYEARGFWEETWLSRSADQYGWDLAALEQHYGLPDAYLYRRRIEARMRAAADHVVTLDSVMADRIVADGVPADDITVVPNGVSVDDFPVVTRDEDLAAEWGIPPDAVVLGYISSLVEYEGIETLISAYAQLREQAPCPVRLLVVGDGSAYAALTAHARALGCDDVLFTGRIPHEQVLSYYSLIDIFVVPRRPVEVCQLVTPLKPFEAFATGRAVVLSDVRALSAIAAQSGAAETFTAGDPESLAEVLDALLRDPQRRQRLAAAGAQWVRQERTWAANARRYLDAYTRAGVALAPDDPPAGAEALTGEEAPAGEELSGAHLDALRRDVEGRAPRPYERLTSVDNSADADEIITTGWRSPRFGTVRLDLPIDWEALCSAHRSWQYQLHCWLFMGPVLCAYENTGKRHYLEWCVERALSWAGTYDGTAPYEAASQGAAPHHDAATTSMAWYDMAVGQRGHKLGYMVEHAVREGLPSDQVAGLVSTAMRHQREFGSERIFRGGSNHGMYVALGQLALAQRLSTLPGMAALARQGRERLSHMIRTQFAGDGGHREHSPGYHHMVLSVLRNALHAGLVTDPEVRELVSTAEYVLGWFVTPHGALAQVGDTEDRPMRATVPAVDEPTAQFQLSGGRAGSPDDRRLCLLPESGYGIVRSPQPTGTDDHEAASYLLLAAQFHSRMHKHADDLTVVWSDRGQEILADAGRYGYGAFLPKGSPLRRQGYRYAAPERQYVESTMAHNTVAADGADHERVDREPYGSALVSGEERDGCFRMVAEVEHGRWRHSRTLVLAPGAWLYAVDTVAATDDAPHDFCAWWNLPEELTPEVSGGALRVALPESEPLWVVELSGSELQTPVSGQREPLRGWRSRRDQQLTPAWSTGFRAAGVRRYSFRTLFWFGPDRPTAPPEHPFDD